MLLPGLYSLLTASPSAAAVQAALAEPPADNVFFSFAQKGSRRPFLILNIVAAPPAEATLDGITTLIEGEIQFDCYADSDKPQQAWTLARALRDFLLTTFNAGALPDGTNIQFVDVTMDHDEPYEEGGIGYLSRRLLRLKAFYTEAP